MLLPAQADANAAADEGRTAIYVLMVASQNHWLLKATSWNGPYRCFVSNPRPDAGRSGEEGAVPTGSPDVRPLIEFGIEWRRHADIQ